MERTSDTDSLVTYLVSSLVDNPDQISVERNDEGRRVTYQIQVHEDDVGKVIGRQGRIIKAIRTLAKASGNLQGEHVYVDVVG